MILEKIRKVLREIGCDAWFSFDHEMVRVISELDGANALLITQDNMYVAIDGQQRRNIYSLLNARYEIVRSTTIQEIIGLEGIGSIGIDLESIPYTQYNNVVKCGVKKIVDISIYKYAMLKIKSSREIFMIKCAAEITEMLMQYTLESNINLNSLERSIENTFLGLCGKAGFRDVHVKVEKISNTLFSFDCGVAFCGYYSDITRILSIVPVDLDMLSKYKFLLDVCENIQHIIKPGISVKELFLTLNWHYRKEPLFKKIQSGFGHGIGLSLHDECSICASEDWIFEDKQTFTIEPILKTEYGDLRIENMFIIQQGKAKRINTNITDDIIVLNGKKNITDHNNICLNPMVRIYKNNSSVLLANLDYDALCKGEEMCYSINESAARFIQLFSKDCCINMVKEKLNIAETDIDNFVKYLLEKRILIGSE